jgi:hypothetical protein
MADWAVIAAILPVAGVCGWVIVEFIAWRKRFRGSV